MVMNFDQARINMIEQQIRPWDVLDQRVLDVVAQVPREDFVPADYRKLAFADTHIPLGHGQVMMTPNVEARLLQALNVQPSDHIFEIGTGSGYLTACLATLGGHVTSMDIIAEFVEGAGQKLTSHAIHNVTLLAGDALAALAKEGDYDVIAVTGSLPLLPDPLSDRLKLNGRLFVILGQAPVMQAMLITRVGDQEWSRESLFETALPGLQNAPEPQRFIL